MPKKLTNDVVNKSYYIILFVLFFISGFSSLIYQIVWLRLAFAAFGSLTYILSVVVSTFMLGLAIGSWLSSQYIGQLEGKKVLPIVLYGLVELMIGAGAFIVPYLFSCDRTVLLQLGTTNSFSYLLISSILLSVSLLPFCILMGTTFPIVTAFVRSFDLKQKTSFSYLYMANVLGAMIGVLAGAYCLIEIFGLKGTLRLAACGNFLIAAASFALSKLPLLAAVETSSAISANLRSDYSRKAGFILLFITGFSSMGMEVVWTRAFTPILSTTVYSFASVLAVYFFATWAGTYFYRTRQIGWGFKQPGYMITGLIVCSIVPIVFSDPRLSLSPAIKSFLVPFSISPVCILLGYLTPLLIDELSHGTSTKVGKVYAVNIMGCILGPLVAAYFLLSFYGVRFSLIVLSLPFLICYCFYFKSFLLFNRTHALLSLSCLGLALFCSMKLLIGYEESSQYKSAMIKRDYVATVISSGTRMDKRLFVNGIGITHLTPITKMMAHLPLAIRDRKPESVLIICMGMGTTFRSAASWDIDTTVVELVPSVRDAFGFYFRDAKDILKKSNVRIIIDDGRRFLDRSKQKYDVITIDPPPPVTSAFSGLLYSEDFYQIAKAHLNEGGILAQWFPKNDTSSVLAVAKALMNQFTYVRAYSAIDGKGVHFFASQQEFNLPDKHLFADRLPVKAKKDFVEWNKGILPEEFYGRVFEKEIPLNKVLLFKHSITDERPFNEYFFLRSLSKDDKASLAVNAVRF